MNRQKFVALLALSLVALALGWWVSQQREQTQGLYSGESLLPGLGKEINQVTGIIVRDSQGRQVSIRLDNGLWAIQEKQGYPADAGKLRSALLILADAKVLEEKTSRPELYSRLGVQDTDSPGADNVTLTIELPGQVRSVILGKSALGSSTYVRRAGEAASLLVNQALALDADPMKWLQPQLLDIAVEKIQSVRVQQPDGQLLLISRSGEKGGELHIQDLPAGRQPVSSFAANGVASALTRLTFDDVRRLQTPTGDAVVTSRFTTRAGLAIQVKLRQGDTPWASFAFSTTGDADKAVATLAADYQKRLAGWEFALASQRANQLGKRMEDLLTPRD